MCFNVVWQVSAPTAKMGKAVVPKPLSVLLWALEAHKQPLTPLKKLFQWPESSTLTIE